MAHVGGNESLAGVCYVICRLIAGHRKGSGAFWPRRRRLSIACHVVGSTESPIEDVRFGKRVEVVAQWADKAYGGRDEGQVC